MADVTRERRDRLGMLASPRPGKIDATMFEGRVARIHGDGDPLTYPTGREYRRADELARIVKLLPGKPVTMLHPDSDDDTVLLNARVIGMVVSARIDGDFAVATIAITDPDARQDIADGVRELSLGYSCDLDDQRHQINTHIDHLAFVPRARCGASCNVRTDGDCGCPVADQAPVLDEVRAPDHDCPCKSRAIGYHAQVTDAASEQPQGNKMDETQKQLAAAQAALAAAQADAANQRTRADAADAAVLAANAAKTSAEIAATNAQASITAERARADAAVEASKAAESKFRKDAADGLADSVKTRVALETAANRVLGATDKDGKLIDRSAIIDRDLKCQVIKHVDGIDVPKDKVEAYVDGVYEGALGRHANSAGSRADATTTIVQMRTDGVSTTNTTGRAGEAASQAALANSMASAWMTDDDKDKE